MSAFTFRIFEDGLWTPGVEVANDLQPGGPRLPTWNPVLFAPKHAPLQLFYKVGPSPSTGWGVVITSGDGGKSWSAPRRLPSGIPGPIKWSGLTAAALPNPNSGTDALTLADGRQVIVYNHSAHRPEEAKGNRWPLDVAVSEDGMTWRHVLTLEAVPCVSGYAYPAVIQAADGKVHLTYTLNRKCIKHVVLDPGKL